MSKARAVTKRVKAGSMPRYVRVRSGTSRGSTKDDLTGLPNYVVQPPQRWVSVGRSGAREWQFPIDHTRREFTVEIAPAGSEYHHYAGHLDIPRVESGRRVGLRWVSVLWHCLTATPMTTDVMVEVALDGCESIVTKVEDDEHAEDEDGRGLRWNLLDYIHDTGWCDHHKAYYLRGRGPYTDSGYVGVICIAHYGESLTARMYLELQEVKHVLKAGRPT